MLRRRGAAGAVAVCGAAIGGAWAAAGGADGDAGQRLLSEVAFLPAAPRRLDLPPPPAARSLALAVDGVTAMDAGALAAPPAASAAACCSPVAYPVAATALRLVAGLRYRVSLTSSAGALSTNKSAAMLRLVTGAAASDADCARAVADFLGQPSALDGATAASYAAADANLWEAARLPVAGAYGLCYAAAAPPSWRALPGVALEAFGAPAAVAPPALCAAEAGLGCAVHVALAAPAGRVRLAAVGALCGAGAAAVAAFERGVSLPVDDGAGGARHELGAYLPVDGLPVSYRICFCLDFEYDTGGAGERGSCTSRDASDFPQALGLLHLVAVSMSPRAVYPLRRFTLRLHCGNASSGGGCSGSQAARVKLVDTAGPGAAACGAMAESASYAGPENCASGTCNLPPSLAATWGPEWGDLVVRPRLWGRMVVPYELGVCYCDGAACAAAGGWVYAGRLAVGRYRLRPGPLRVGRAEELRLEAAGAEWTDRQAPESELKLVLDPNGTLDPGACHGAEPSLLLGGLRCRTAQDCDEPPRVEPDALIWPGVTAHAASHYAACYCDAGCGDPAQWGFVAWHLAAGPRGLYVGSALQGAVACTASRFEVTVEGVGLSAADAAALLPGGDADCAAGALRPALVADRPALLGAAAPGDVALLRAAAGGGVHVETAAPHGVVVGDRVRLASVVLRAAAAAAGCESLPSSGASASPCVEALVEHDLQVVAAESAQSMTLDARLTAAQCAALDASNATWWMSARETYAALTAPVAAGRYTLCWARSPRAGIWSDYAARVGTLEVVAPALFASAFFPSTVAPDVAAPAILAFVTGNAPRYGAAAGPMGLRVAMRDASRVRHGFSAEEVGAPRRVDHPEARQAHCGRLFLELWSEADDGFPQPDGCFYDEALHEYGMRFPPGAGLRPGTRYQIVLPAVMASSMIQEHDWRTVLGAVPTPEDFAPEEVVRTALDTWGDAGPVASATACKEVCAALRFCNVAVYRADDGSRCLVADFSTRAAPFALEGTEGENRTDVTMFMLDRLNTSHPELTYIGTVVGKLNVVADLFSLDDLLTHPFGVIERSEASSDVAVGLAPAAPDPRWHPADGLAVLGAAPGAPLALLAAAPALRLRLRSAEGAPIAGGAALRLALRPLTAWAVAAECEARCAEASACGRVECRTSAIVTAPWVAAPNALRLVLPQGMAPITDAAPQDLLLHGPGVAPPAGGFFPTRFGGEVVAAGAGDAVQPRIAYTVTTGALPYAPVPVAAAVLALDGGQRPFAADRANEIFARLRLGAALLAGPQGDAEVTLRLPAGYRCLGAMAAPPGLATLLAARTLGGPEARGTLSTLPGDGSWSSSGASCTYRPAPHGALYGGSLVVALTVDNPPWPLPEASGANVWATELVAPGMAEAPLHLPAADSVGPSPEERGLFTGAAAVLGRLAHVSVTPSDFWAGAPRVTLRVFLQPDQSTGGLPGAILLEVPDGFHFGAACTVADLPATYYRPPSPPEAALLLLPLGRDRRCRSRSPRTADIDAGGPLASGAAYGLAVLGLAHPGAYCGACAPAFRLTTMLAGGGALDRAAVAPLLPAAAGESYGLYSEPSGASMLSVSVEDMLPYAHTGVAASVTVLFRVPLDSGSSDPEVAARSRSVSWRVFAPMGYVWSFGAATFHYHTASVPGATADLPVRQAPQPPNTEPLNRIDFQGILEHSGGWQAGATYGFRAGIRVPPETPRLAVNEWIAEWGYDGATLANRSVALLSPAPEVRAVHSFLVWGALSSIEGGSNEVLFQFGTATAVPAATGALVIDAPLNFVFEAACSPRSPAAGQPPYLPVPARLDCAAEATRLLRTGGAVRPRVVLRPTDRAVPPGEWALLLACVNPPSAEEAARSSGTFLLRTYSTYTGGAADVVADMGATAAGFEVKAAMPMAEIVSAVDYAASGRDDHPGGPSWVVLAFELREEPVEAGAHQLQVLAPEGIAFGDPCRARTGLDAFGPNRRHPEPYVAFEPGARLLGCAGAGRRARLRLSPGLRRGRRYAFAVQVAEHPAETPARNEWVVEYAGEASRAIAGYELWSLKGLEISMLFAHTSAEAAAENRVDFEFTPTNTMRARGLLLVAGPAGFAIPSACAVRLLQLADAGSGDVDAEVPGATCHGERPPSARAQIRFTAELSVLARGVRYRVSLGVASPRAVPLTPGKWQLATYSEATPSPVWVEPERTTLLDVGSVPSPPLTKAFAAFAVHVAQAPTSTATRLELEFSFALSEGVRANDVVLIEGPVGYGFAAQLVDAALADEFRDCAAFAGRSGALPRPMCAGASIRLVFVEAAGGELAFSASSQWPTELLDADRNNFVASLRRPHAEGDALVAAALAPLPPLLPRFAAFALARPGPRAQAVGSRGRVRLDFVPSQGAQAIAISTRIDLPSGGPGANLSRAVVEVRAREQLLKQVQIVRDGGERLVLALEVARGTGYTVILRGVENPQRAGVVLWTVRSFGRPRQKTALVLASISARGLAAQASPPHLAPAEEVLSWLTPAGLREEMVDWATPAVVGRVAVAARVESSFFDFAGTAVSFAAVVGPTAAQAGARLLVFAPARWQLLAGSFEAGEGFPPFEDLGVLRCLDPEQSAEATIYAVRLLGSIRPSPPCDVDLAGRCPNEARFALRADTPPTPSDMARWQREADAQAWLVQIDAHANGTCGPEPGRLSPELVAFSNDALFPGFALKESIGGMAVRPEPGGQHSRQHVVVTVDFTLGSALRAGGGGVFLRVAAPVGVEFDFGCLAAAPDPDYALCRGDAAVAVVTVREAVFASGEHQLALSATNPPWTPEPNFWTLETLAGVGYSAARAGAFADVRQRGRSGGYGIVHGLLATLQPASTEANHATLLLVWLRPQAYVEPGGVVELHAGQGVELGCSPGVVWITMPPGRCRAFSGTSAKELQDVHYVVELQLGAGGQLLPNNEYGFAVSARSPAMAAERPGERWGLRLRSAQRLVLEANLDLPPYRLTSLGMTAISIAPSTQAVYATNEVRLLLSFERALPLTEVSEIRIVAPDGWDFQPLCSRFTDVTGGCGAARCGAQLPYSLVRGHHICPQPSILVLLLDQRREIAAGVYTLLLGVMNPAAAPSRNCWSIALLSAADIIGWTPNQTEADYAGGLLRGQRVLSSATALGFEVGGRSAGARLPPVPLEGQFFELLSGRSAARAALSAAALAAGLGTWTRALA